MPRLLSRHWIFSFLILLTSTTTFSQKGAEILWDNYGVPHVYASSSADMYYAFGWSQMEAHADLILQLYGEARGRAAEYWGENFIELDKTTRLFDLPGVARKQYSMQKPEGREHLDAFVKGLNDYAIKYPGKISADKKIVLPVTVTDVLAHHNRVICLEFMASDDLYTLKNELGKGSNSYAVGPSRSASGNAMLVANPHLPWFGFFLFFEAHLSSPGFNAYGVSLVGMPMLAIAFNEHLGWTHTVNVIDACDRYELQLKDGGYVLDDKVESFTKKQVNLKVKTGDGKMRTENITMEYSKHGPVVGRKDNKAYAVRIAGLENANVVTQYHEMAKAQNLKEFETAVQQLQMPMFNVVYADKDGHILYVFNGDVPVRPEGDFRFWQGTIDGTKSKYIWNKYHSYKELPRLLDPITGFVQNANDPPWTSTYPGLLKKQDFPAYMSGEGTFLRPQRAIKMMVEDSSITYDELVSYKLSTRMEAADRFLDDLLKSAGQEPDSLIKAASEVLRKWDRCADVNSRGAVLFENWLKKINPAMFAVAWDAASPITTPRGLKDPAAAVKLFREAAEETIQQYKSLDVAWGEVYKFKLRDKAYPANGGPDMWGIFRVIYFNDEKTAVGGDTFVAVVEFGKKVNAQVLLSYGNSSQPGNKHIGDQLQLLSEKKLRPAHLDRNEIKNVEKKETLPLVKF
ncbi:MAG: acylase [Chitinophagaceae bacterium]|nr:acylase [Chitinophagaceae bacterium]